MRRPTARPGRRNAQRRSPAILEPMPGRLLAAAAMALVALLLLVGAGGAPAAASDSAGAVGRSQTTAAPPTERPTAQEAVGTGGLRYWLIAALLALLAVLVGALGVVYWKVTVPPGKRQRR
jgi:hypothetical protein